MSKIYRVLASSITYYAVNIEADSLQEAYDTARELDGGVFVELQDGGDWQIDEAVIAEPYMLENYPVIYKENENA